MNSKCFQESKKSADAKRISNREKSTARLRENGIVFKTLNDGWHLQIETQSGKIDFYPSTGLYQGALSGRGVFNLIKALGEMKNG